MKEAIMSDETQIAVMANDISYIKKSQDRIEISVKELANVYSTKQDLQEVANKVKALERQNNLMRIVSPAVASVITAVVVFLLINYLQSLK